MEPKVDVADGGLLQLKYQTSHKICIAAVYPLTACNGSTIIVCGHEQGLLIIWRGGHPFKPAGARNERQFSHASRLEGDETLFEDKDEGHEPSRPYHKFVQQLDLPLATGVLYISFPRIPQSAHRSGIPLSPAMLEENIVAAVACADGSVGLLKIPMTPPNAESKERQALRENVFLAHAGHGSWGEQMFTIPNPSGSQNILSGISLAFAPRALTSSTEDDMDNDDVVDNCAPNRWDALIASYTSNLTNALSIHKIPISSDGQSFATDEADQDLLWRSQLLPSNLASAQLHVSTNSAMEQYPRVLVALANGPVKIFECCQPSNMDRGRWLLSLYPGITASPNGVAQHRPVLDAKWVLDGDGIVVLMADGEWGVWDLSAGKTSKTIAGGIPTKFSTSGWISGSSMPSISSKGSSGIPDARSKLAPMTPATRKIRQDALFSESLPQSSFSRAGGICVDLVAISATRRVDENLLIWHGDKIVTLPNLRSHLQAKLKGAGSLFGSSGGSYIREASYANLDGEVRSAVASFPMGINAPTGLRAPKQDILVSGESRFVILASPLSESQKIAAHSDAGHETVVDQKLLERGELDVNGMDRILDGMANGSRLSFGPNMALEKPDGIMDMG